MRTRPPGPAPTRRGQSPAPAPHPRIADVHNGGGARGSLRVVNAQSAATALRSDAGEDEDGAGAGTGAGAGAGEGLAGAAAEEAVRSRPATGRKCAAAGPALLAARPMCGVVQRAGWASPRGGLVCAQANELNRPKRRAGVWVGRGAGPARRYLRAAGCWLDAVAAPSRAPIDSRTPAGRTGSALFRASGGGDSGRGAGGGGDRGKAAQQSAQHLLAHG